MLEEIQQSSYLGSPEDIYFLITDVLSVDEKSTLDIRNYIVGKRSFKDLETVLAFLVDLRIVHNSNDNYSLTQFGIQLGEAGDLFKKKLVIKFFEIMHQNAMEKDVIDIEKVELSNENRMFINPSFIALKFSAVRNFLLQFGFLDFDSNERVFYINNDYHLEIELLKQFFYVNNRLPTNEKKLTLEQFKVIQQIKEELGREAEEYCVRFEQKRLEKHPKSSNIRIISNDSMSAGYDIESFEDYHSININRYIEVKSYRGNSPYFYWSSNEVKKAKELGESYYLYLVERGNIDVPEYSPVIIKNPYVNVIESDEWVKNVNINYYISGKNIT
jgi:hypothetical protein